MVALVYDKLAIVRHQIRHLTTPYELWISAISTMPVAYADTADDSDILGSIVRNVLRRSTHWVEQLATMHQHECIARPLSDERSGHHGLAKSGRGRQHAMVVRHKRIERLRLRAAQCTLKVQLGRQRVAGCSEIFQRDFSPVAQINSSNLVKAASRQSHVPRMKFGA